MSIVQNEHVAGFLDVYERDPNHSRGSYKKRRSDMRNFDKWLRGRDIDPVETTPEIIEDYLNWLRLEGYKPNSISGAYDSLKLFYDYLAGRRCGAIEKSPFEVARDEGTETNHLLSKHRFTKPLNREEAEAEDEIRYVSAEEVDQICEHVPDPKLRNELLLRLMFQTAVRESEAVEIKVDDIDRGTRTIKFWRPKTSDFHKVHYQPSLDFLLTQWIDYQRKAYSYGRESPYLFVSRKSAKLAPERPNKIVKQAAENAGIQEVVGKDMAGRDRHRITAHTFRHGHAVHALKSGVDVRAVQEQLGHADIERTMGYLQYVESDVRDAYKGWSE